MLSKSCTLSNYGNKQFFEWIKLTDYPLQRRPHEQDTFCPIFNHRIGLICDSGNSIFVQSTIWSCEEFRAGSLLVVIQRQTPGSFSITELLIGYLFLLWRTHNSFHSLADARPELWDTAVVGQI